jgi:hypothetical protein
VEAYRATGRDFMIQLLVGTNTRIAIPMIMHGR